MAEHRQPTSAPDRHPGRRHRAGRGIRHRRLARRVSVGLLLAFSRRGCRSSCRPGRRSCPSWFRAIICSPAVALNSVGLNVGRAVEPALSGILIASSRNRGAIPGECVVDARGNRGARMVAAARRHGRSRWPAPRPLQPASARAADPCFFLFANSYWALTLARPDARSQSAVWPLCQCRSATQVPEQMPLVP